MNVKINRFFMIKFVCFIKHNQNTNFIKCNKYYTYNFGFCDIQLYIFYV